MKFDKYIRNPKLIKKRIYEKYLLKFIKSDEKFVKMKYKLEFNKKLDLKNPKTYNEKLQWLKLYDRRSIYTLMVDKYEVKKLVASIIGEDYIIPTIGVFDSFDDIDFDLLPNQFVIKCTHDSGGLVICRNKSDLNIDEARKIITESLRKNYYYHSREWPYKNVVPRIIIEKYMEDNNSVGMVDYKLFCFAGIPKILYISSGLENHDTARISFFDMEYNELDLKRKDYKKLDVIPNKPKNFEKMKKFSEILSRDIPQLRVDFYEINGKLYFGELTFFTCSGFIPFEQEEWDKKLGDMLQLPSKTKEKKFILLYDCPFKKCDKIWLYNGLKKYGDVRNVDIGVNTTYFRLVRMFPKIGFGKVLLAIIASFQTLRALIISKEDDIIVVWNHFGSILINEMCAFFKLNRKIVSFNWIRTSRKKDMNREKKCFTNKNFIPIINDRRLEKKFVDMYNLAEWNGMYLPDVFDNNDKFLEPYYGKERYCFAGGVNNRDWDTLIEVARSLSTIKFVIVSEYGDIKNIDLPENVEFYESIPSDDYYNMLKNSYLVICPLKEDKVSGLINIIKTIQYGIPCITVDFDVTSLYYPDNQKNFFLYKQGDCLELKDKIQMIFNLSKKDYIERTKEIQSFLKEKFNPNSNIDKLIKELERRKWL